MNRPALPGKRAVAPTNPEPAAIAEARFGVSLTLPCPRPLQCFLVPGLASRARGIYWFRASLREPGTYVCTRSVDVIACAQGAVQRR
jgi:hypothetical protein